MRRKQRIAVFGLLVGMVGGVVVGVGSESPAIAKASFKKQDKNAGVTEYAEMQGRGHSLTIDNGWQDVADAALEFVRRFVPANPHPARDKAATL